MQRTDPSLYQNAVLWVYLDISQPVVAWATYTGRLESVRHRVTNEFTPISFRHAMLLRESQRGKAARSNAEARLEAVRRREFPEAVSRLTGLYFFEDELAATRAEAQWGGPRSHFRREWLVEVGFSALQLTRVDSEWITRRFWDGDADWMRRYWAGEAYGAEPLWEVLVEGMGLVWGTAVREAAWTRLGLEFPGSVSLLDLARIAQELGDFNFGRIVPYVRSISPSNYRIDYLLDFRDAQNPDFLRRLREYRGPRRSVPGSETQLIVPDLRPYGFSFELASGLEYPAAKASAPNHGAPPNP